MRRLKSEIGSDVALFGLLTGLLTLAYHLRGPKLFYDITGPFTLASHLRGTDIFLDTMDDPEYLKRLMAYTSQVAQQMCTFYLDAGMDVIAIVDPVTSQVSPKTFATFLADPFSKVFEFIREQGAFSSFFVCGDATKNIEVMCQTQPDCIAVDENIDMVAVKPITDRYNIVLEGNIPLTTRMLLGNQQDNMKYIVDLLDALPDHHNLIISPGCDMPYDTPIENVIAAVEAIRDPKNTRLILANYHAAEIDLSTVVVPDYAHREVPLMEVFTLDSSTCAACGYMLSAAERVTKTLGDKVEMIEYKMTKPENIARMKKMGVVNLPCILINGELRFSSLIPNQRELQDTIESYAK